MELLTSSGSRQLAQQSSMDKHCLLCTGLLLAVLSSIGTSLSISPTFHHILLVVTVIVTVSGAVVDVKSMDGSVVVAGWDVLQRTGGRAEISRDVHTRIVLGEEQLG